MKTIPNNNGRVGVWGVSYHGFYATMTILSGHPALKAASPQAPVTEWFLGDDWRHNGALFLAHAFGFLSSFGRPRTGENEVPGPGFDYGTPDGYDFFLRMGPLGNAEKEFFKGKIDYWQELISHDTYSDYWKSRDPLPYLKNVRAAVMTVGGWFDAEDAYGAFHTAQAVREQNPGAVNILVAGPWSHGQWGRDAGEAVGDVHFLQKTGEYFHEHIEFPFFQRFLKDEGDTEHSAAYVFETGRNAWHTFDRWPPPNATPKTFSWGWHLEAANGQAVPRIAPGLEDVGRRVFRSPSSFRKRWKKGTRCARESIRRFSDGSERRQRPRRRRDPTGRGTRGPRRKC